VVVNAFLVAMVGLERTILPAIAEHDFHLAARAAVLSFIVVFGVVKARTNHFAGRLSDARGRKVVLVAGWIIAAPVPFMLMWAPSWNWVLVANVFLGTSQVLTWSMTVIMKIDLAGPQRRGLAMGLNEFAGYGAVALSAWATGYVASIWGLRPQPFYLGIGFVLAGVCLSAVLVRETHHGRHSGSFWHSRSDWLIAFLTLTSGLVVLLQMHETTHSGRPETTHGQTRSFLQSKVKFRS